MEDTSKQDGLPYLIIIVTLVLCSLLLATIALIIVVIVIRQKRKTRSGSVQEESIAYGDDLGKPETRAMEVQPDLRSLEPRSDPRAFMPFAPIPTRRYASLPFESQRRLIPVPEEEGSADERLTSPEEIFAFPVYELDISGDDYGDMEYQQVTMEQGDVEATAVLVEDKTAVEGVRQTGATCFTPFRQPSCPPPQTYREAVGLPQKQIETENILKMKVYCGFWAGWRSCSPNSPTPDE